MDASRFELSTGSNLGTFNYSDCSAAESALECQLIVTSTTKTVRIYSTLGGARVAFPSAITISLSNLFLTPLAPPTNSSNATLVPLSGLDVSGYTIYSSASTVEFSSMCTLPCAICPSRTQLTVCLSCYTDASISSLKYLYGATCYLECPIGTLYPGVSNSSYPYTCVACSSNCSQCIGSLDFCLTCPTNNSLYQHSANGSSYSVCVANCPNQTYVTTAVNSANVTASACLPCLSPCLDCTDNTTCLSCLPIFYQFINASVLHCLLQCPIDVTVSNSTSMTC